MTTLTLLVPFSFCWRAAETLTLPVVEVVALAVGATPGVRTQATRASVAVSATASNLIPRGLKFSNRRNAEKPQVLSDFGLICGRRVGHGAVRLVERLC